MARWMRVSAIRRAMDGSWSRPAEAPMCLVPSWLLFQGGRYDLAKLDTPGPPLARNDPDADHPRELRVDAVWPAATDHRVRAVATAGTAAVQRPVHVLPALLAED